MCSYSDDLRVSLIWTRLTKDPNWERVRPMVQGKSHRQFYFFSQENWPMVLYPVSTHGLGQRNL